MTNYRDLKKQIEGLTSDPDWNDVLQQAETQDEADYIKDKVKHYAKISDRYCDKA